MIINLSNKPDENKKILCEWSDDITDQHLQDFCSVANKTLGNNFTVERMRKKYAKNIYGDGFIIIIYQDDNPVAIWAVRRNDLDNKTAFQLCDLAVLPEARDKPYVFILYRQIVNEIKKLYPDAILFGYPNETSHAITNGMKWTFKKFYFRFFRGVNKDFSESVPMIEDLYAEHFLSKCQNMYVKKIKNNYYVLRAYKVKKFIPMAFFMGRVSDNGAKFFKELGGFWPKFYWSVNSGYLFLRRSSRYILNLKASEQDNKNMPPLYKADYE